MAMTAIVAKSSTTASVSRNVRSSAGARRPTSPSAASAKAMSVAIGIAQPSMLPSPAAVRPGAVELGGADRPDADLGEQLGHGVFDESLDLRLEIVGLGLERENAPRGVAQREHGRAVLGRMRRERPQSRAAVDEPV